MYVKIHKSYRGVVAICDSDLISRKFEEGNSELFVRENFFKGEEKTDSEIEEIMEDLKKEDATFNIVGKKAIAIALKVGLIKKEGIRTIGGVPFALVLM
jgi:hypothetical protein